MKVINFWPVPILLFFTSCSFQPSANEEQHKTEFALHKMRTDIEELKQDLNSNQMELNILEGKILNQDNSLSSIKEKTLDSWQDRLEKFQQTIAGLDKRMHAMEKKQEKITESVNELTRHANETTTALSQYKSRIAELENLISFQNDRIKEVTSLRQSLETMANQEKNSPETQKYRVQKGDTLKKIAKAMKTTPEELKDLNRLSDDMIYVDQEILIPKIGPDASE